MADISFLLWFLFIGISIIILLSNMIFIVREKTATIVERFGKFSFVAQKGLNIKFPYPIDKIVGGVSLQILELKSDITAKSKDNAFLTIPIKIQYRVLESKIREAFYELDNPEKQMGSYVFNIIRAKSSTLTMDELFQSKNEFEKTVMEELNTKFENFGYVIDNVLVDDPQPSAELIKSFNNILASEKEKEAAKNVAESLKIKLIGEALAEKESLKLKGEAFKEYRSAIAEGNIEAMGLLLGTHAQKTVKKTIQEEINGELTDIVTEVKEITKLDEKDIIHTGLTHKDILNFFAGVDEREAIRDASKGKGNTVIFTNKQTPLNEELIGLINLSNKK